MQLPAQSAQSKNVGLQRLKRLSPLCSSIADKIRTPTVPPIEFKSGSDSSDEEIALAVAATRKGKKGEQCCLIVWECHGSLKV